MRKYKLLVMSVAGFCLPVVTSQASLTINNGGTLTGLTLAASVMSGYSSAAGLNGTLLSQVYTGANAFTVGGDTFVYTLSESAAATDDADGLSISGFAGSTYSIDYENSGGVSAAGSYVVGSSGVIPFLFNSNLTPGSEYDEVVVYDSLPSYDPNFAAVIDSSRANTGDLAPAPVPEASTLAAGALMLLPLGVGLFRVLRKQRSI
jgi:hypothetical protein